MHVPATVSSNDPFWNGGHVRVESGRGVPRETNDMLDTTLVLFCVCGAKMTAAVVLIGAIYPLPSREFALGPSEDLDAEIVGV